MFDTQRDKVPALVLNLDDDSLSLWDPEVNNLVDALEDRLDGVFVTFAAGPSGRPSLADALAAVRYAGCSSAVVVAPESRGDMAVARSLGSGSMPLVEVSSRWTSAAIAEAYQQHHGVALERQAAA